MAEAHLSMIVGEDLIEVAACDQHVEWLRAYAADSAHGTILG